MAVFLSSVDPRLGELNVPPFLALPALPNIVSEWVAIIPLACHLASHRHDYRTTGEVALLGRLSLSLFPKLGTLAGMARLLERGPEFFDQASTRGGTSRTVWDVLWGSVFPCANGAASSRIVDLVMKRGTGDIIRLPEHLPKPPSRTSSPGHGSSCSDSDTSASSQGSSIPKSGPQCFRRYQTLRIFRFRRKIPQRSFILRLDRILLSVWFRIGVFVLLLGIATVLSLIGAYGTSVVLLSSAISQLATSIVLISRPPGYLESNETQQNACMLVATHQNAMEWHLHIGDRSVVDTLLNKPMIQIPKDFASQLAARWFRFAHVLQLLATTFVAGQKGWDGVSLVILIFLSWILQTKYHDANLARRWLDTEGIEVEQICYEFSGRMIMLAAVQIFSGSTNKRWWDDISAPHPRRDALLERISGSKAKNEALSERDLEWVEFTSQLSEFAADTMKQSRREGV